MDSNKQGVISKVWRRCRSLNDIISRKGVSQHGLKQRTKSLSHRITTVNKVAPVGCFPIYVGPEKERFLIRTEHVNHPLFKNLLEEAESEYGYGTKGPLMLPCEVDHFVDLMTEMDCCDGGIDKDRGCSFAAKSSSSLHFLTPPRLTY